MVTGESYTPWINKRGTIVIECLGCHTIHTLSKEVENDCDNCKTITESGLVSEQNELHLEEVRQNQPCGHEALRAGMEGNEIPQRGE